MKAWRTPLKSGSQRRHFVCFQRRWKSYFAIRQPLGKGCNVSVARFRLESAEGVVAFATWRFIYVHRCLSCLSGEISGVRVVAP